MSCFHYYYFFFLLLIVSCVLVQFLPRPSLNQRTHAAAGFARLGKREDWRLLEARGLSRERVPSEKCVSGNRGAGAPRLCEQGLLVSLSQVREPRRNGGLMSQSGALRTRSSSFGV